MLAPRPASFGLHRELFPRYTGLPFDPVTPGLMAADATITALLDPERAARLVSQAAYDRSLPSFGLVLDRLMTAVFDDRPANEYEAEVNRAVTRAFAERLMTLAGSAPMPQVRAIATLRLRRIAARMRAVVNADEARYAHAQLLAADINRFITRPGAAVNPPPPPRVPPGAPIGAKATALGADLDWCTTGTGRAEPFFLPLFARSATASTRAFR